MIWWCTPSARPIEQAKPSFDSFRAIGCKLAATRKDPADCERLGLDLCLTLPIYPGYYAANNLLAREILKRDPECTIVACGGDDVFADPNHLAVDVEREFIEHFGGTLGVMQPVGEVPGSVPWSMGIINGLPVQKRIAWAPWLGREWCERAYMGTGPFHGECWHYFGDEFLQLTAQRLGLFWQRDDIHQDHRTWKIEGERPRHLFKAYDLWDRDKAAYDRVAAPDWPGAKLLPK